MHEIAAAINNLAEAIREH